MPGMKLVHPQPRCSTRRTRTSNTSPGRAPRIATGPVSVWMRPRSRVPMSATVLRGVICPPLASWHSRRTVSPGSTDSAGGSAWSQRQ